MTRLLLIDDDDTTREVLALLLTADGWQVAEAPGGDAAIVTEAMQPPDVILCDLHMPGLCGTELAAALRKRFGSATAVLAMTATQLSAPPPGYDALLVKPFDGPAVRQVANGVFYKTGHDDPQEPVLARGTFDGLKNAMPDTQLRALYDLALTDAERRLQTMRAASNEAALRTEAHALKGSFSMIGALRLRALTAAVEEGALPEASMRSKMFSEFDEELSAVRRMLEVLFAEADGATHRS